MKIKALYGALALTLLVVTGMLLFEREDELILLANPMLYSVYHSDSFETVRIDVLTNDEDHYFFGVDYIGSFTVENDEESVLFQVQEIKKNGEADYDGNTLSIVSFFVRISFASADYEVHLPDARVVIRYENGVTISFPLGELAYVFQDPLPPHVTLSELQATHETINGVNTIGGVHLRLANQSSHSLYITSIDVVGSGVSTHLAKRKWIDPCPAEQTVEGCIGEPYSFSVHPANTPIQDLVLPHQTYQVYVPLSYGTVPFLYEMAIRVTYRIEEEEYVTVIDDFPFMRTPLFQSSVERWYQSYELVED